MADQKPYVNRLFNLFNLSASSNGPVPTGTGLGKKNSKKTGVVVGAARGNGMTTLQSIFHFFLSECMDTSESLKNREIRYKDLDFMKKNDPVVQMAADLYADEAVQGIDGSGSPVRVKAKSDVQSYIEDLLLQWGYTQPIVRELIFNKVMYGDSFDANKVTEKEGIVSCTPLSIFDVRDRIEFDPSQTLQGMNAFQMGNGNSKLQKLQRLQLDLQDSKSDPTAVFQKYLFGFELNSGLVVPPWGVSHYRSFSLEPEFAPWGRSRFINTLSTHRQLLASRLLMQVARAASLPRDLYEVKTDPGMTQPEQWDACEEFQEQLDNAGLTEGEKEMPSIGSKLIMPMDLARYTQLVNNIDPSSIADVEYLRDDEILSTFIPKGYLITDKASFGTSGQSLLQQFKPFGRRVFSDQSDFLKELTFKIKTHLAIVNKFQGFDTIFELSMEFPVIEESSDRIQRRGEELDLAQKSVQVIKDVLGFSKVPPDIVKDAFRDLTFLDPKTIDSWVSQLIKANPEPAPGEESGNENGNGFYEKVRNRFREAKTRDSITEKLLAVKAGNRFYEGVASQKHYYSSCLTDAAQIRNRAIIEGMLEGDRKLLTESFNRADLTALKS